MNKQKTQRLYIVSLEIIPKQGAEMWGKAEGGFLYCILQAKNAEKAAVQSRTALEEDSYEVVDIEEVIKYENMDWESEDVAKEYEEMAIAAQKVNDVFYGPICVYDSES